MDKRKERIGIKLKEFLLNEESGMIFTDKRYDYKSLKDMRQIAKNFMQQNSIPSDKTLAIALERSPFLIIAILAAMEYGVPFLPIDLTFPDDRIRTILSDAKIETVITSYEYRNKFDMENVLLIEDVRGKAEYGNDYRTEKNEIAYVLYTSGSTGTPKGVEITREGLANAFEGFAQAIDFSPGKRIACFTTVSFDIFFLETLMALYHGLIVVFSNEAQRNNPKLMANLIVDKKVDMLQMTPSRMQLLLNHDNELSCLKAVKEIMIGGEPFPHTLLEALQTKTTAKIFNMYGPTETTIWSCVQDLTSKTSIDIGKPILNTQIYILDKERHILPKGGLGEIAIAGKGLAKGYVNDESLTKDRFIYLPEHPQTRVYLTGDLGKYLTDGNLECLGRMDNQIKIRGYRVELEEIENILMQYPYIDKAVVVLIQKDYYKALVAFYLAKEDIMDSDIIEFLNQKLPTYMIPIAYYHLTEFLYTNNDKIDRKQLLNFYDNLIMAGISKQPKENRSNHLSSFESRFLNIIGENIDDKFKERVAVEATLNELGIDSINFIKIIVTLEAEFDFEFDEEMLIYAAFSTIQSVIDYVKTKIEKQLSET